MRIEMPAGRIAFDGPKPFRVEYPYGRPGDGFRGLAPDYKATCVAYHRGVDPRELVDVRRGNGYRYGPGDELYERYKADMAANGYRGGDGQRIHIHVRPDDCYVAEGNHRLRIALEVGVTEVEIEVRYYCGIDAEHHLIPFDDRDPDIVVHD